MKLSEIIERQRSFDRRHGWNVEPISKKQNTGKLTKDLIGLFGEIGEFSNLTKKLGLVEDNLIEFDKLLEELLPEMKSEIVDCLIYLIRLSDHINLNLEEEYLDKVEKNNLRFAKFEKY